MRIVRTPVFPLRFLLRAGCIYRRTLPKSWPHSLSLRTSSGAQASGSRIATGENKRTLESASHLIVFGRLFTDTRSLISFAGPQAKSQLKASEASAKQAPQPPQPPAGEWAASTKMPNLNDSAPAPAAPARVSGDNDSLGTPAAVAAAAAAGAGSGAAAAADDRAPPDQSGGSRGADGACGGASLSGGASPTIAAPALAFGGSLEDLSGLTRGGAAGVSKPPPKEPFRSPWGEILIPTEGAPALLPPGCGCGYTAARLRSGVAPRGVCCR